MKPKRIWKKELNKGWEWMIERRLKGGGEWKDTSKQSGEMRNENGKYGQIPEIEGKGANEGGGTDAERRGNGEFALELR